MIKNIATLDKVVRGLIAVTIFVLILMGKISGIGAIVFGALALIFVVTSLLGFCPLYRIFGFSTCKIKE